MSENNVQGNGHAEKLLPPWLTNEYLEKILQEYENNQTIKVFGFDAGPATAKGNHYASVMFRVNIQYKQNDKKFTKSLIIKTIHQEESSAKLLEEFGTHFKEMTIYGRIIPEFESLLQSVGDTDKLCPYTYAIDHKNQALVFQDLKATGYDLVNRKIGVDWSHLKLYLRKIAKFHACSKVLVQNTGETFPEFQKGLMNKDVPAFNPFFKLNIEALAREVEQWKSYEKYAKKLYKLVDLIIQQGTELFLRDEKQFNVLIHGDSWVNNMLFKYDDQGNPIDVILVTIIIDRLLIFNVNFLGNY